MKSKLRLDSVVPASAGQVLSRGLQSVKVWAAARGATAARAAVAYLMKEGILQPRQSRVECWKREEETERRREERKKSLSSNEWIRDRKQKEEPTVAGGGAFMHPTTTILVYLVLKRRRLTRDGSLVHSVSDWKET